jgi:hypothetical protein
MTISYKNSYIIYKAEYCYLKSNKKRVMIGGMDNKYIFEEGEANNIIKNVNSFCEDITCDLKIKNWKWDYIKKNKSDKMKDYVDFRKKVIDDLIRNIFDHYKCENNKCEKTDSGSVGANANLYSDYDLTIVHKNLQTANIIKTFNSIIQKVFDVTPAEAFDTNLYGYSCIINTQFLKYNKQWEQVPINDSNQSYLKQDEQDLDQDKWALKRLITLQDNVIVTNDSINNWINRDNNDIRNLNYNQRSELYIEKMRDFEQLLEYGGGESIFYLKILSKTFSFCKINLI